MTFEEQRVNHPVPETAERPQEILANVLQWKINSWQEHHAAGMPKEQFDEQKRLVERKQEFLRGLPDEIASLLLEPDSNDMRPSLKAVDRVNRLDATVEDFLHGRIALYSSDEAYVISPLPQIKGKIRKEAKYVEPPPVMISNAIARPTTCEFQYTHDFFWTIRVKK